MSGVRGLLGRRALLASIGVALAFGGLGAGVAFAVGDAGHPASRYGGLPSYLPASSLRTDGTEIGTSARPALTSQGDAVRVRLPHGSALVNVTGPQVPGEGFPFQASADTATWVVTLSHGSGRVPISTRAFSTIDSLGKIYHPGFVPGQPRPPKVLRPGRTVHFELRVVMRVGEGMMRWAPVNNDLVATWDFVVEND